MPHQIASLYPQMLQKLSNIPGKDRYGIVPGGRGRS
jgi:hypothetical protein